MTRPRALVVLAGVLAISAATPLPRPGRAEMLCPHATIVCVSKLGYNFQLCGSLADGSGVPVVFPTCLDRKQQMCVPCWFDDVAGTSAECRRVFGPECSYFMLEDDKWEDLGVTLRNLEWPDLTPLTDEISRLFGFHE